ncbi:dihydrofolate reductase family protein [Gordonia rubripertincta]|uniref:Dihydrofolate reductase family protein n=1 Tax=Gordonia rubripertincta TaxID=36822 RepID=A0ABT4N2I6_GORRU|nr:dihydrofolate reductase family protein [Gordonia rubripertincta]MCZ4552506.1 dihydrofolate reductase family protein [Gordonia rubripertincta]
MRKLVYYIGISIDGFIAGPDDEVDFFPMSDDYLQWMGSEYGDALPAHVRAQFGIADAPLTKFDTILMGRRTYDPALAADITSPYPHLTQYVVSRSHRSDDPAITVIRDEPDVAVEQLKAENSGLDIYLAGGGALAGQLLPLIDELVIKTYPVVAGAGRPAFVSGFSPTQFDLADVRTFSGGNVVSTYSRK